MTSKAHNLPMAVQTNYNHSKTNMTLKKPSYTIKAALIISQKQNTNKNK